MGGHNLDLYWANDDNAGANPVAVRLQVTDLKVARSVRGQPFGWLPPEHGRPASTAPRACGSPAGEVREPQLLDSEVVFVDLSKNEGVLGLDADAMVDHEVGEFVAIDEDHTLLQVARVGASVVGVPARGDEDAS